MIYSSINEYEARVLTVKYIASECCKHVADATQGGNQ